MIYLITGANGTGKTLFTLKWVRDKQLKENRAVYYNGRFSLKEKYEKEFGWEKFDFQDWESLPDGAIVLVDEAHNDMPKTPTGSRPQPHIAALGEHRRRGFDFFLITQHPQNIDPFVRKIIGAPGWHKHLKRVLGAAEVSNCFRWDYCEASPEQPSKTKNAEPSKLLFPREVYDWYDSAVIHTGKLHIPKYFWFILVGLILIPTFIYSTYRFIKYKQVDREEKLSSLIQKPESKTTDIPVDSIRISGGMSKDEYLASFIPRIENLPHTAPRYDEITKPVEAPYPAVCMILQDDGKRKCQCYTQQATKLQTPLDMCISMAENGYFRDWKNPSDEKENQTQEVAKFEEIQPPISQTKVIDVGGRWDVQRWKSVKSTLD